LQLIAIYACLFFKACNPYSYGENQAANLKKNPKNKKKPTELPFRLKRAEGNKTALFLKFQLVLTGEYSPVQLWVCCLTMSVK